MQALETHVDTGKSIITVEAQQSAFHIEVCLQNKNYLDEKVIQEFIKEYAASPPPLGIDFKVVILKGADSLSHNAQAALRRIMEVYINTCKFILVARHPSQIMTPLHSRCQCLRVGLPTVEEIQRIIQNILKTHPSAIKFTSDFGTQVAVSAQRNLHRALMMAETMCVQTYPNQLTEQTPIPVPIWETEVGEIARLVTNEYSRTVKGVKQIRKVLEEIFAKTIKGETLLPFLANEVARILPQRMLMVYRVATEYDSMLRVRGRNPMHVIEAFLTQLMVTLKQAQAATTLKTEYNNNTSIYATQGMRGMSTQC